MTPIAFTIPLRTRTGLNAREHHFRRAERVARERRFTAGAWLQLPLASRMQARRAVLGRGCVQVTLVRVGPRKVDDDGASGGMKAVRDAIAESLGVDDGDRAHVRWRYGDPEIGNYAVRVRIEDASTVCRECGRPLEVA